MINLDLYIEIENLTYPHCGYVVLEPESFKILEAKKDDCNGRTIGAMNVVS
jgi:hypothetical protein